MSVNVIEKVAEAMWSCTHEGEWPRDAEKEFVSPGRGISTATVYRVDAQAAVNAMREIIIELLPSSRLEAGEDDDAQVIIPPAPPPPPKPNWKEKRGL